LRVLAAVSVLAAMASAAVASSYVFGIIPKSLLGPGDTSGRNLSCEQGRDLVRAKGYSSARVLDCRPRFYMYLADRQGHDYIVTVDSQWRRIVGQTKE